MTAIPEAWSIVFFHADDDVARSLEDHGMMSAPDSPAEVYSTLNLLQSFSGPKDHGALQGRR